MRSIFLTFFIASFFSINLVAQTPISSQSVQIENITEKLAAISKSLGQINERLQVFSETFSSNQGLRLTERQQTILIAFEFLNRAEQRLATLQKLKIEFSEKQSTVRLKIAETEENLRAEVIDKSFGGTTNAEEIRVNRRRVLNLERSELGNLFEEIERNLRETDNEIRDTEMFLKRIRNRIFPAIDKEISDL